MTRLTASESNNMKGTNLDICSIRDTCAFCLLFSIARRLLVLVLGEDLRIATLRRANFVRYSCRPTLRREGLTWISPSYWMKPSFLNLFMKKLTRDRVVPIISASISSDTFGSNF